MKWEQCDWVGDGIDACHQQQLNWADGEIDDHQQTQAKILLLSIKPEFSSLILDRKKTVELRRVRPKQAETGSLAVVYVTAPVQAIVFAFLIKKIVEEPIDSLWEVVKDKAGITRYEFDDYYQGAETGVGIFIDGITGLIQQKWEKPPQSFAYITEDQLTSANGARCRLLKKKGRELSPKSYPKNG